MNRESATVWAGMVLAYILGRLDANRRRRRRIRHERHVA